MRDLLVAWLLLFLLVGCGGAKPPNAPTSDATKNGSANAPAGAEALVEDTKADLVLSVDLAGMRADPVMANILTKAEAHEDPKTVEALRRIDRIDARASMGGGGPSVVAVVWGNLPADPQEIWKAYGSGELAAEPALGSGVHEYSAKDGSMHLFVVKEGVWVVSDGSVTERVHGHFATTADPPATPSGDLVHIAANSKILAKAGADEAVQGIDHVDITVRAGVSSIKGTATFKDEARAKEATKKIRGLAGLLTALVAMDGKCKALEKLVVDVANSGADVTVELKGIDEVARAWDPAVCGRSSGSAMASSTASSSAAAGRLCMVTPAWTVTSMNAPPTTRKRELLAREIEGLEKLVTSTAKSAKDRAPLVLRTAHAYAEWVRAADRDCGADKEASATASDVALGKVAVKRTKELCKELEKSGAKQRCR